MIVELKNITKYYQNSGSAEKRIILDDLSLAIAKGESIAIVGPSGSGKSTLLNVISSLDTCNSGNMIFDAQDLSKLNEKELANFRNQNLGFVFQSHHLLPQLSLLENVLLPYLPEKDKTVKKEAEKRALDLLEFVGLSKQIHQRPGQMSGGECQRAAVVRALIHQPKLILADEPTGSLDKKSAEQLGDLLVDINEKQAVSLVVVTHSMDLAKKMKKIYQLEDGKLNLL
ncbi:ABC transporter ATP-binding protein [Labilibaculum sp. DW002]|uniref:ABC transporter ATP-binding protein n=1 Tax=Paralabilibaculum antarcticum TaxID=2912572 RepID=A0ABT5VNY9_9BACT|nr:ABC transporter ATP-binding protein [Labilibaculum sp. DW002]MDE5416472.1 ABC transporter ATP-binding protein [Labilibaculum sp. DW002]